MVSYRFCRTDDVELLVDALNECYFVHFPDASGTSVAEFKRDIREMDLWCSSCMVGVEDKRPIAVISGAKRTTDTLIACHSVVGQHVDAVEPVAVGLLAIDRAGAVAVVAGDFDVALLVAVTGIEVAAHEDIAVAVAGVTVDLHTDTTWKTAEGRHPPLCLV